MAKEWTDDEVRSEIKEAIRIVREDRFESFVRGRLGNSTDNKDDKGNGSGNSGNGNSGDGGKGDSSPKKKGLWWGETE